MSRRKSRIHPLTKFYITTLGKNHISSWFGTENETEKEIGILIQNMFNTFTKSELEGLNSFNSENKVSYTFDLWERFTKRHPEYCGECNHIQVIYDSGKETGFGYRVSDEKLINIINALN